MKRRKLGCLTSGGLITFIISLIVIGVSYAYSGNRMFSPGDLNQQSSGNNSGGVRSHAELEKECASCHPAFWNTTRMTDLCLDCHQAVLTELADTSTLHGAVMAGFETINCRDCHTEHEGPQGNLTEYLPDDFQHELVGYALSAHQQIDWEREMECIDCHRESFTDFRPAICLECHGMVDDEIMLAHTNLFGSSCLECHDGIDTYGSEFDHAESAFPMDGRHQFIECQLCHQQARTLIDLQMTPTECQACHLEEDPHSGVLGTNCGDCHNPSAWDDSSYDHSQTGFLLYGGHDNLACENCHADLTFQGLDSACISCHADDEPHQGQFGQDCALCHVVTDWLEVTFDHSGDYANDCIACHTLDKPANHYNAQCSACHSTDAWLPASFNHSAAGATDCLSCHTSDRPSNHFGGQCSQCHNTNAWLPASFNHSFPLNHGGANQRCQLCHTNNNLSSYTCYGCHEHSPSEINSKHKEVNNFSNNCIRCHADGREHDGGDDD